MAVRNEIRTRRSRRVGRSCPLASVAVLLVALAAQSADHGDPPIGMDVLAGLDLAEGPPYPTTPVEVDAEYRQPPDPVAPVGRLILALSDAIDEVVGSQIAISSSFVDNGDPFGEPGDTLTADVYFVGGSPPVGGYPPLSSFSWLINKESRGDAHLLEFTDAEPITLSAELFFDSYHEVEVLEEASGRLLERMRLSVRFEVAPSQGLKFENARATPKDASGAVRLSFELNEDGSGGSVDTTLPVCRVIIKSQEPLPVPALPRAALVLFGALVFVLGVLAAPRVARRFGSTRVARSHGTQTE